MRYKIPYILISLCLLIGIYGFSPPCKDLTDIPDNFNDLVPVSMSEGRKEIHIFRKYFITKRNSNSDASNQSSQVVWELDANKDLILRLRVQSPNTDFKISLTSKSGKILSDATSISGYGASISSLISKDKLDSDNSKVLINFSFYDYLKTPEEIIEHEDVHDCHLPHIVLEMSIMEKDEFKSRKEFYNKNLPSDTVLKFPELDSLIIGYVDGAEQSQKQSSSDNFYALQKSDSNSEGKFQILKEFHITISSEEEKKKNKDANQLMYYLQMQITHDFMTSGSLHMIIVHEKDDKDPLVQKDKLFAYDSLNCAEEQVCIVSQKKEKNQETMNIAVTEGNYGIYFVDYQNTEVRNFIADNIQKIPFSFVAYLYPIESQENSIYCDGLAVPNPYFIPFVLVDDIIFDQKIEVDFRNTTQDFYFDINIQNPSYLRVTTEQDIGMDVDIKIFDTNKNEIGNGKDIGSTETIVSKIPMSGRYKVQLNYRNSIIRDLNSCPQVHLIVALHSKLETPNISNQQMTSYQKIESIFQKLQNAIDSGSSYSNDDEFEYVYSFNRESFSNIEENVYENKLVNTKDSSYWVYFEIFCDQVLNDVVVDIDFSDRRFTRSSTIEKKLNAGQTDQMLRSQKALHTFSMIISYKDTYNVQFLSRNMLQNVTGIDDKLKQVYFQMKVKISPLAKKEVPLSMSSLLPKSFNNLRDLGVLNLKYNNFIFVREKILLSTSEKNSVTLEISKPSKMRVFLKSNMNGVSLKSVKLTDSSGNQAQSTIVQNNFNEIDVGYAIKNSGMYTLTIETQAKKSKNAVFFMKVELDNESSRKQCSSEEIPSFDKIAITSKRSDTTQETHYYLGTSLFRNVYHLGQMQLGSPTELYKINLPTSSGKNYGVIPFTLKSTSNLVTVNLFHNWVEDLVKLYIIGASEDPDDLFSIIRDQKETGDHSNISEKEKSILQSKSLPYFEGIEKAFLAKGEYKLVIMTMDPGTDKLSQGCFAFSISIYVEEELKRKDSKAKSEKAVNSYSDVDDSLDETIIESLTLCQHSFIFEDIFKYPLKVNGGILSIDSIYRFDNEERYKKIELEVNTNSVIHIKATDFYNEIPKLEIALVSVTDSKANLITSSKAEKSSKYPEKYAEILRFVKKGKYIFDLSNSVFDYDTSMYPCHQIRVEIEVRSLTDFPDSFKSTDLCSGDKIKESILPVFADNYNKVTRFDSYYSITDTVSKTFNFKISEPTFLMLFANFEPELTGSSYEVLLRNTPVIKNNKNNKENSIFSNVKTMQSFVTDSADGSIFIHELLEPYTSNDSQEVGNGNYTVNISSKHKVSLTKSLEKNNLIPRCSKVSFYYKLVKVSDIESSNDEEYEAAAGENESNNKNCKDVEIDSPLDVQKELEKSRGSNSLDIHAKLMIPDPASKKKLSFFIKSVGKPLVSILKITASFPEDRSTWDTRLTNMKIRLNVVEISKSDSQFVVNNGFSKFVSDYEQNIGLVVDESESKTFEVTIEFEEYDFKILQTQCGYFELRIAKEPSLDLISTLNSFERTSKYEDASTLSQNPKTITINKVKSTKLPLYYTKNSIESRRTNIYGKINLDVDSDNVQVDIFIEFNYLFSDFQLELIGNQSFKDIGVFEAEDKYFDINQAYTAKNSIRLIGSGDSLPKGQYTLIIKERAYIRPLLKELKSNEIPDNLLKDITIPFMVTIESVPTDNKLNQINQGKLTLIDVEYNGNPDDDGKSIIPSQTLSISLEFNDNLDSLKTNLQGGDGAIVTLKLDKAYHKGVKKEEIVIIPNSIERSSTISENVLQVTFDPNTLRENAKYKLELNSNIDISSDLVQDKTLEIQTMALTCNPKGIFKSKTKSSGSCACKYPYTGKSCSQCLDDYHFNPKTNECILWESCQEDTCNGHGKCSVNENTGVAECACDPGFADDNEGNLCMACENENQIYPDCKLRSKASAASSECYGLTNSLIPKSMNDSSTLWKDKVGDVKEFVRTYSVKSGMKEEVIDLPVFDEATVVKIFFKASPGLTARLKLEDSKENVLHAGTAYYEHSTFVRILIPDETDDGQIVHENALLTFEYQANKTESQKKEESEECWRMEVIITLVPFTELVENLKCSVVKQGDYSNSLNKVQSKLFDIYEFNLDNPISIDEKIYMENEKLKLKLKNNNVSTTKNDGNIMINVYYDFPYIALNSKLRSINNALQTYITSGEFDVYEEELGTETSLSQISNVIKYTIPASFYADSSSYLEAEFYLSNNYLLLFDKSDINSELCFPLSISIEYIPPKTTQQTTSEDDEELVGIKFVKPAIINNIPILQYSNITLEVELDVSLKDAFPEISFDSSITGTMVSQMCALSNNNQNQNQISVFEVDFGAENYKTDTILPIDYEVSQDFKKLYLQFPVHQAYEKTCYKLVCKSDITDLSNAYFDVKDKFNIQTKYCFEDEISGNKIADKACNSCNPLGTKKCSKNKACVCSHPYTGTTCNECVTGFEISTSLSDGSHKCVKSETKCSPDFCNFKGTCEMKTIKSKSIPFCNCTELYDGRTCNKCKNTNMQYPGCYALKDVKVEGDEKSTSKSFNELMQSSYTECQNIIPPTLDTYENLKYNGEARVSGVFSLTNTNNKIEIGKLLDIDQKTISCLQGEGGSTLKIYVEFLEDSYINAPLPVNVIETVDNNITVLGQSYSVFLPNIGTNSKVLRGEYLELKLQNKFVPKAKVSRTIQFEISQLIKNNFVKKSTGCFDVYLEISLIPNDRINPNGFDKCNQDYDSQSSDTIFGNKDVLKISPGFEYTTVINSNSVFTSKSLAYKESDGIFFKQKDIELTGSQVQSIDFVLSQNFDSSAHIIGMLLEIPLDGNHDAFMHGESQPDCIKSECILADKMFNANSINFVFNSNIMERVRIWLYRVTNSVSSSSCTPFHLSIKSTKNYKDTHPKENVACWEESFPLKLTNRRYSHDEIKDCFIVHDFFRVDSFILNDDGDIPPSSIILNSPSLVKVIISKEQHLFGYEVTFFESQGTKNNLIYSTSNQAKSDEEIISQDIRVSLMLPSGQYLIRIKALIRNQDFVFKTCDTVKIYVGIIPIDKINDKELPNTKNDIPDFGFLLNSTDPINVSLPPKTPQQITSKSGYALDDEKIYTATIKNTGASQDIGFYLEISEIVDQNVGPEVNEITGILYPDLEIQLDKNINMTNSDIPIISTASGKTFMFIQKLSENKVYKIEIYKHKLLTSSSSITKNITPRIIMNAYIYSSKKKSSFKSANIEVNGMAQTVPVKLWTPPCSELVLTPSILSSAIQNTITSGVQYEEIYVLNDEAKEIFASIPLSIMKNSEASLLFSISPYSRDEINIFEELMITSLTKGQSNTTTRSQEFEGNIQMLSVELDKNKQNTLKLRINYSLNMNQGGAKVKSYESQCNMIRLSIQYITKNRQSENQICSGGSYEDSIKSIIPSILPDSSSSDSSGESIKYEYSTVSSSSAKFKLNVFKPDQNKLRFTLKKASTFRFEMISYPCISPPIERSVILRSVSKTHNKITKEIEAVGVLNVGNSNILYVNELMPGNYELEISYGWMKNYKQTDFGVINELVDFQIEIYSLHQDESSMALQHYKDRNLKMLETAIRDLSVVTFMNKNLGQYYIEDLVIPQLPGDNNSIKVPFKIVSDHSQVLVISENFTYIENIEVMKKETDSSIKRITSDGDKIISEILPSGEYYLLFHYKGSSNTSKKIQNLNFGISDYKNVQKYNSCTPLIKSNCINSQLDQNTVMLQSSKSLLDLTVDAEENELFNVQFHYNIFLTQKPITLKLDSMQVPLHNEKMKNIYLTKGTHTLKIIGPDASLDGNCVLLSLIEYEIPTANLEITQMPGINLEPGIQSMVISNLQKGMSSIALPSLTTRKDALISSTLVLHFDYSNQRMKTPNYVDLNMNFDTNTNFNYAPQLYYETIKDKIISYVDITGKPGADITKQFEVVHTKDVKSGRYLAHFVVMTGDQIASNFDKCNAQRKSGKVQTLDQSASFLYNEFGKEDFEIGILKDATSTSSKFYDSESKSFYIEFVYEITKPSFIDFVVEYDISVQNVDIFIFRDFNDTMVLEDEEIGESELEIPSVLDSTVSRHASIYLIVPGKYSLILIDQKLPSIMNTMSEFEDIDPCVRMKISHSIQSFSASKLVKGGTSLLSIWPRRIEVGDPFFANSQRNLEIFVYPNTIIVDRKSPPNITFSVIDLASNKRMYNIQPDKTTVLTSTRQTNSKNATSSNPASLNFLSDIKILCAFTAESLKNVIGGGKVLTLQDPDFISDRSFVPYYVIIEGQEQPKENIDTSQAKNLTQTESIKTTQKVKSKLELKKEKQQMMETQAKIQECSKTCKNGSCDKNGDCKCKLGFKGKNCDEKKAIGNFDKIREKAAKKAEVKKKSAEPTTSEDSDSDEYNYDDDEDMLKEISYVTQTGSSSSSSRISSVADDSLPKKAKYSWFDMFLVFLLLLGIAIIFYQNLWSGRFCRKKFAKKLKFDDEDNGDQADKAIIREEFAFMEDNTIELPRVRKRHDD